LIDNINMVTTSGFTVGGTFLTAEQKAALEETAAAVATPGKGITACDESPGTIGGRFEAVGVENTEENRRKYRQMLFEAPGCENFLSAAILDKETLYQKSDTSGKLFPQVLAEKGIVPGIKPHLKVGTCSVVAIISLCAAQFWIDTAHFFFAPCCRSSRSLEPTEIPSCKASIPLAYDVRSTMKLELVLLSGALLW
jgi:hypothetical protein